MSYYPYWHGSWREFDNNIDNISQRYNKDLAVMETAYAFTLEDADGQNNIVGQEQIDAVTSDYPASVQSQAEVTRRVMKIVHEVPNDRGIGVFYWEGEWIPVEGAGWKTGEGNAWENKAMFDFEKNALKSLSVFNKVVDTD